MDTTTGPATTDDTATAVPPSVVNADPGTVTVWSDIGCPWATLALHTLHARAAERGLDPVIDHRAFPLELFNAQPTPKYILDAEIATIAGARPEVGWRAWTAPEWTYPVTTLFALEAVQAAKDPEVGGLRGSDALDTALRRAFYVDNRCIGIIPVVLEVARECELVDADALAGAMARGAGRAEVSAQWKVAAGEHVQGSPHLFTADYAAHNPGARYHWTARPPTGFPRLDEYHPEWADELLDKLIGPTPDPATD